MKKGNISVQILKQENFYESKQILDPFSDMYGSDNGVYEPPINIKLIEMLADNSNIVPQCVDAIKTNTAGFGWELVPVQEGQEKDTEYDEIHLLFDYCHLDTNFSQILQKIKYDEERTGNGYLEVIRNTEGKIVGFERIAPADLRISKKAYPALVEKDFDTPYGTKKILFKKSYRNFVQIVGRKKVYFKPFGFPKDVDFETGEVKEKIEYIQRANEIIHFKLNDSHPFYGVPRFLGTMLEMTGSLKSAELNVLYFSQGRHIPMAILVNNGYLTQESLKVLKETLNNARGTENAHQYMLLEAVGETSDENKLTSASIEIKPLVDVIQQDALFIEYDDKNRSKIRSAFRLPPLFTGESSDYSRATAKEARKTANEQVFRPEQNRYESIINRTIVSDLGIKNWKFKLNSSEILDAEDLSDILKVYQEAGAVTLNMAIDMLNKATNGNYEPYGEWGDYPIQLLIEQLKYGLNLNNLGENGELKTDPMTKALKAFAELRHQDVKNTGL